MGYASKTAMRRWHVKRQIASAERRLADLRAELVTLGEPSRRGSKRPVACGDRWFPSLSAAAGGGGGDGRCHLAAHPARRGGGAAGRGGADVTRDHALLAVELATRLGTTPALRDRHGKGCYLYLIRETGGPGEHLHKVGIARDVRTRLAQLQTANGRPLTLASWWHTPNIITARRVERTILDRLAERRQVGEWLCGPVERDARPDRRDPDRRAARPCAGGG
jgi:hypothetical protein